MDFDIYVSNLHKWFCTPRGCSFMYIKNLKALSKTGNESILQPMSISLGFDNNNIDYNFAARGTGDQTNLFLIDESIKFNENYLGGLTRYKSYSK